MLCKMFNAKRATNYELWRNVGYALYNISPRLNSNLGYGATGGTSSGITQYRMVDNLFQTTGTAGDSLTMTYSAVYTITSVTTPNNFLTVSAIGSTNALIIVSASIGSKITATRIA